MNGVNEKDWKLYRSRIAAWQEAFMGKLLKEYAKIINSDENPSQRFWTLNDKIKADKELKGVLIDSRRSLLADNLAELLLEEAITIEDLEGFSDELIKRVKLICNIK